MPSHLRRQRLVLRGDRLVPVSFAPEGHLLDGSREAALGGLVLHHPVPLPGLGPEVGEAEEIEASSLGRLGTAWATEVEQPRLLWVEPQAVLTESFRQHAHDLAGVVLALEHDHEVVGVADQGRLTAQARLDHLGEPPVEDLVKVDVCQQRGDHPALWRAVLGAPKRPFLQHARLEPLVDHAAQNAIAYPLVEKVS